MFRKILRPWPCLGKYTVAPSGICATLVRIDNEAFCVGEAEANGHTRASVDVHS